MHKRLLQLAEDPARLIIVVYPALNGNAYASVHLDPAMKEDAQSSYFSNKQGMHPPPIFGSSPNLEAFQACRYHVDDGHGAANSTPCLCTRSPFELLMGQNFLIGLNIQEAHAFSTVDGFSLDIFVVDGWLRKLWSNSFHQLEKSSNKTGVESLPDCVELPSDGTNVLEIDTSQLKVENNVASGSYGDFQEVAIKVLKPERVSGEMLREFYQEVYIMRKVRHKNVVQFIGACTRSPNMCIVVKAADFGFSRVRTQSRVMTAETGTYHWMDPEVGDEREDRKVRHKNVVQFIGACTRSPNMCIVTESSWLKEVYKGVFKLPSLIKVAVDVSKGMNYLHENNINHKDLKAANLLMDENEEHFLNLHVVKAADFGFSRVRTQSRVMTAETGTYHWMDPEVIVHKPYDHKAAVLSFGIVACELLAREVSAPVLRRVKNFYNCKKFITYYSLNFMTKVTASSLIHEPVASSSRCGAKESSWLKEVYKKGVFKLPSLIKVAVDVSKGMNYLHQNNIIHKDLKAANLLMDENEEHFLNLHVVKAADFGFSRVRTQSGVMTAETGTYHWMAPEKPYDHKAAVLSFGIVACELLAREVSAPVLRRVKKFYNCKKFITYYSLNFMTKVTASSLIHEPVASSIRCGAKVVQLLSCIQSFTSIDPPSSLSCGGKGVFKLPSLIKVAVDVSKGMNYLHQNNIIHKDLKAANLLMDENEEHFLNLHVVKAADFGFSRVRTQSGVMTAETGTYHWMAPEKPYDHKAAVLSFGIVGCELLAREVSAPVLRRVKKFYNCKKFITYYSLNFMTKVTASSLIHEPVASSSRCGAKVVQLLSCIQSFTSIDPPSSLSCGGFTRFLHEQKGVFKLPSLIKVAVDVSKGMNYLHQNNIIHKDLKAANLLMDENEEHFLNLHVVKAADFGFSRVRTQSGVMTAETGTYHWMAPEKPYDHKAAVLSFGIVGCELLAREVSAPVLRRVKKFYNCKKFITYYSLNFMTKVTASSLIHEPVASSSRCGAKVVQLLSCIQSFTSIDPPSSLSCGGKGVFKLPSLIKVAVDVSKGMNYLHQNNIIHKDLKAANLLMDENEEHFLNLHVVKAADFGFSRVRTQSGVMTAETGTYHWMAPEKPYDHKAAVLSFGIVGCELLAREVSAPVLRRVKKLYFSILFISC
ncbi:hypothetical protein NC653_018910 [Populus alba x Populus x berolinensis]|uniref:Protein kinase domain-containing protein n=1 Tax=Populus alba x Populus x berolinensis TaxID=444605 RepID=A0AAD6QHI8_9ROSI|nr:hypothetical protein NC653_018910 [Populus alba x Populus x berolinensis]